MSVEDERALRKKKTVARAEMREVLKNLPETKVKEWSAAISEAVLSLDLWHDAEAVLIFLSMPNEVATDLIIRRGLDDGRIVCVPRMYGSEIQFHSITSSEGPWEYHQYGVREPAADAPVVDPRMLADGTFRNDCPRCLVLTPGLAFDRSCRRLGHGKGYYDKFLAACGVGSLAGKAQSAQHRVSAAIGLGYEAQMVEEIPTGSLDVRLDGVVNENGLVSLSV